MGKDVESNNGDEIMISNVKVYGIEDSFKASKYPFAVDAEECNSDYTERIRKLGNCEKGSGHDNFLNGIVVQFDLKFSIKVWTEEERYHFIDFVSSQSTMHMISKMDIKSNCVEYVTDNTIAECERLKAIYLETKDMEDYMRLLYNVPVGFQLTARMTTNYRQLKTIYAQRKNHRLKEWRDFCAWIETLPYSELITGQMDGEGND